MDMIILLRRTIENKLYSSFLCCDRMKRRTKIKLPSLFSTRSISKPLVKLPSRFYNPCRKKRPKDFAKFLRNQNNEFYKELIKKLERETK